MALLLMRSGKQILRLSSSSSSAAAVAARSQRQLLKGVTAAGTVRSFYMGPDSACRFSRKSEDNKEGNDFEIPQSTWKSIFTKIFRPSLPPTHTPFQGLLEKFMDLAEQSKRCPEDRIPSIFDDIRPVLSEFLDRMSEETVVRFVYEFARPAASSPPPVIDRKVKAMVDSLPSHVTQLFIDMMLDMIRETYSGGSYSISFDGPNRKDMVLTADVSDIGKEHLKLLVIEDYLLVTGTDKDAPPAPPQLLALDATIRNILKMPACPYYLEEVTASLLEDQEQGSRQIKIVVPCHDETEVVPVKPRVFQLNLDTKGAHQG